MSEQNHRSVRERIVAWLLTSRFSFVDVIVISTFGAVLTQVVR